MLDLREREKESWASGAWTDMSQFGTAILNAKAIGKCELIEDVVSVEYEQLLGEKHGEPERTETPGESGPG